MSLCYFVNFKFTDGNLVVMETDSCVDSLSDIFAATTVPHSEGENKYLDIFYDRQHVTRYRSVILSLYIVGNEIRAEIDHATHNSIAPSGGRKVDRYTKR